MCNFTLRKRSAAEFAVPVALCKRNEVEFAQPVTLRKRSAAEFAVPVALCKRNEVKFALPVTLHYLIINYIKI